MSSSALMDEIVEEVFFRLPPEEPAYLVRASLVCKPWRRILADPAFRRRYRKFHRAPPLVGLLYHPMIQRAEFVSTSTFRPAGTVPAGWYVVDCRHGRVLLIGVTNPYVTRQEFLIWDPMTDERRSVPRSPSSIQWRCHIADTAVVLCATQGCDHLDCHGGPFRVAFLTTTWMGEGPNRCTSARLYSSETGAWSEPTSVHHDACSYVQQKPTVLVGDALYFSFYEGYTIEFQLGTRRLLLLSLPAMHTVEDTVLMSNEDGGLGFASVDNRNTSLYPLTLWSWEKGPNEVMGLAQRRVFSLKTLLPDDALSTSTLGDVHSGRPVAYLSGSVEGTQIIFVGTDVGGVYMVELKLGQVRKVLNDDRRRVYPYRSFYIPAMEAASVGEPQKVGA